MIQIQQHKLSKAQISVAEILINAIMIYHQVHVLRQEVSHNGRNGTKLVIHFAIEGESDIFCLETKKNGESFLFKSEDGIKYSPIHKYFILKK